MKLIKRTEINKPQVTYNLHIEKDHNYIVENKVVAKNCHQLKANSLKGIIEKLENCKYKVGLTGTLDGMQTSKLVVEGLTGSVFKVATTNDLMNANILSKLKIKCLFLKYSQQERQSIKGFKYNEEIDFLMAHQKRNEFITKLSTSLKGNTLVLFRYVEKHGKLLYDLIKSELSNTSRKVFFVSGETEVEVREQIRSITEKENDAVLVCSQGTFSVGINIRRLHNIVFASPSKGRIKVLQSIGRQLRKSSDKDFARLYDISDDLSWKSSINFSHKHLLDRLKIYNEEKFNYEIIHINL